MEETFRKVLGCFLSPCIFNDLFITFILCALVFHLNVYLHEGFGSPGIGVSDSCELPYRCWELNPGPLEEQPVPLITEPCPEALKYFQKDILLMKFRWPVSI